MRSHVGVAAVRLGWLVRAKWWLVFHLRWVVGRGSRDGKVRYLVEGERLRVPLDVRIMNSASRLHDAGHRAIVALAAAEAVELGIEHRLLLDHIEFVDAELLWRAVYETRDHSQEIVLPLRHTTEATQRGIATLN